MKLKIILALFAAVAIGALVLERDNNAPPTDLRDAVADELKSAAGGRDLNNDSIPMPQAAPAMNVETGSKKGFKESLSRIGEGDAIEFQPGDLCVKRDVTVIKDIEARASSHALFKDGQRVAKPKSKIGACEVDFSPHLGEDIVIIKAGTTLRIGNRHERGFLHYFSATPISVRTSSFKFWDGPVKGIRCQAELGESELSKEMLEKNLSTHFAFIFYPKNGDCGRP